MRKEIGVNNVSLFFRNPHPPTIRDSEKKGLKKIMHPFSRLAFMMNIEKKNGFSVRQQKKYRLIDVILYYSDYNSVFFVFFPITY